MYSDLRAYGALTVTTRGADRSEITCVSVAHLASTVTWNVPAAANLLVVVVVPTASQGDTDPSLQWNRYRIACPTLEVEPLTEYEALTPTTEVAGPAGCEGVLTLSPPITRVAAGEIIETTPVSVMHRAWTVTR